MAIIIGAVLSLLCIAVLFYPFFKAQRAGLAAGTLENAGLENDGESPQELESVYQAIRTLQLEHQLGRVPDSSYKEQLDAYRLEAAEILRSRALGKDDSRDPGTSAESEEAALEREVLLARALIAPAPISAGPATQDSSNPETVS
ncbi:MAG: hypothetical protein ACE1Y2_05135 [Stenotrophomonas maltophilia]